MIESRDKNRQVLFDLQHILVHQSGNILPSEAAQLLNLIHKPEIPINKDYIAYKYRTLLNAGGWHFESPFEESARKARESIIIRAKDNALTEADINLLGKFQPWKLSRSVMDL